MQVEVRKDIGNLFKITFLPKEGRYFSLIQYNGRTTEFSIDELTLDEAITIRNAMEQFIKETLSK
jgi:hypothetical protein